MTRFSIPILLIACSTTVALAGYYSLSNANDRNTLPKVAQSQRTVITDQYIYNDEASIPSQCYTKTEGQHNPCYTCHQIHNPKLGDRLNQLNDGSLQGDYEFSDVGVTNHWSNLFKDRTDWLEQVSDESILKYINQENYQSLATDLKQQGFEGYIPDLKNYHQGAQAFDEQGLAKDGSKWVAFNYKPFPGTFWPTNGSTDDVVIRLDSAFRQLNGSFNRDIYYLNLTLAELNVKDLESTNIWPIDETLINEDIDGNGLLETTTKVKKRTHYFGDANNIKLQFQQFPTGTEFMHSVRYVGITDKDEIVIPPRMKELRYMRKVNALPRHVIISRYGNERKEKLLGLLPKFIKRGDQGLDNGLGWFVQGFIEDYDGELRQQSYEETMFCMGCHAAIGTTIDSTFSYARKVTGAAGWKYINLNGMKDAPSIAESGGEIYNYLKRAGGGSEFRENPEMQEKWFNPDGTVKASVKDQDIYTLLAPSRERTLKLNKAYTHIVRHQSFKDGRDATWLPANNVFESIDETVPPLKAEYRYFDWDIRLNWQE
ncbi:hypothetical protein [Bermanella sp. R86510]|uniref:hypothetical protein n=1 Tax=unclassified Bermanella TaxID=2627862 RepID=UPI0037C9FA27